MAKLRPNEKRAQLSFVRPEDLRLYDFLSKRAYEARYEIGTFILVSLHEAFKGQVEEEEVNALAEEAARKVRDRIKSPMEKALDEQVAITINQIDTSLASSRISMEQAAQQAEAQIAQLDAIASTVMKKKAGARKGVPSPPMPPQ
jgi:hypothetical protein